MIEANKIVYYGESGSEYCILYASIARIGIVQIRSGIYFDELPFDWQTTIQEALELALADSCDDTVTICDGDILQLHTDYVSNYLFDLVCKTAVYAIIDSIMTSCLVVKSASVDKEEDVAKIYFKATETQKVGVYADLRDLHIDGINISQCESEAIIAITRKDLPPELEYNDIIEKVCDTIAEYIPID